MEPHHQIIYCHIIRTLVGEVVPLSRDVVNEFYNHRTLVEGVLPLCRDAVGIFYSPSRLSHRTLVEGVLLLCRDTVGVFYSPIRLGRKTVEVPAFCCYNLCTLDSYWRSCLPKLFLCPVGWD